MLVFQRLVSNSLALIRWPASRARYYLDVLPAYIRWPLIGVGTCDLVGFVGFCSNRLASGYPAGIQLMTAR